MVWFELSQDGAEAGTAETVVADTKLENRSSSETKKIKFLNLVYTAEVAEVTTQFSSCLRYTEAFFMITLFF